MHWAVREMKEDGELPGRVKVRSSQYLNNLVEQDHRRVKQRTRPVLGFKRVEKAENTEERRRLAAQALSGSPKPSYDKSQCSRVLFVRNSSVFTHRLTAH
jgi:transposase-like protein